MRNGKLILVVDDDPAMSHILRDFLIRQGYSVAVSSSYIGAMGWMNSLAAHQLPDLVLSDVNLGGPSGIDLAKTLNVEKPAMPVVLFSVFEGVEKEALQSGARRFIRKPFSLSSLARVVNEMLQPR